MSIFIALFSKKIKNLKKVLDIWNYYMYYNANIYVCRLDIINLCNVVDKMNTLFYDKKLIIFKNILDFE